MIAQAHLTRAMVVAALNLCVLVPAVVQAGERSPGSESIDAINSRLQRVEVDAVDEYLKGDSQKAVGRLQAEVDPNDWQSLLVLGNMTFTMHPAESFQWHKQAYELSKHDDRVLLELAFHYTRRKECSKAVEAWTKLEKTGLMNSYLPMLAAYCYLELGEDKQAFSMFERAAPDKHGRFEEVLVELWDRRPALVEHADHLRALLATGALANLDEGLENALRFETHKERGAALVALTDAARPFVANIGAVSTQLDCLRPAFQIEASDADIVDRVASDGHDEIGEVLASFGFKDERESVVKKAWKQRMDVCGLLIDDHPLPDDPSLTRLLAVSAINMKIATAKDLLAAHGKALAERARSQAGDLRSLRVLAALQELAKDPQLVESDDLGWSRYGDPKFAYSRVIGQLKDGVFTAEGLALLEQAHKQFPLDHGILRLWLSHGKPPPDVARNGWRELALMEFQEPTLRRDPIHLLLSAPILYLALRKYKEMGLDGTVHKESGQENGGTN